MTEFQKMLLIICFFVSILAMVVLYTLAEHGYSFEACRDNECRIYKVKIVGGGEKK